MAIRQISLTDFRNLQSDTIDCHDRLNLIYGINGSGKTSFLEALFVLCQGRSFRSHQLKNCAQHDKAGFLLFGRFNKYRAGLSLTGSKIDIKINGEKVSRRSELVKRTPIQILNSDSFQLVEGSPEHRRKYLDWCLFHVKHGYAESLSQYNHCLKQRNALLKSRKNLSLLSYWNEKIIEPAENINSCRQQAVDRIQMAIINHPDDLIDGKQIELKYQPGWSKESDFKLALERDSERDIRAGYTNSGIHRGNILITSNQLNAEQNLSRGQKKRLSLMLLVEGLEFLKAAGHEAIILLIDDLSAELDKSSQKRVINVLDNMGLQLFVTNTDPFENTMVENKEFKMFHVEHGNIVPQEIR